MPFKTKTVMEEKLEFVQLASSGTISFSALCVRFGISRPTGYKWLKRYRAEGAEGLSDRSKRPNNYRSPTSKSVEKAVLAVKAQEPRWGSKKLRVLLEREGLLKETELPSERTISRILKKHGKSAKGPVVPLKVGRFEYEFPNQLWQMDFKGHFEMANGARCYPLTITDDHSRFNIVLTACRNQKIETVKPELIKAFKKFGLPETILCDNAAPWGATGLYNFPNRRVVTQLQAWLIRLGVKMIHGRPHHPQTQGKCERFHRTLKHELLEFNRFRDLDDCQIRFQTWRHKYNNYRPHEALEMKVPADRFEVSLKAYPSELPKTNYSEADTLVIVTPKGYINFKGKRIYVGEGLKAQTLALRRTDQSQSLDAFYCNHFITKLDLEV